ncbi:MAG: LPS export ABC transporter permease LptG [Desulfuromonadales bacterium]|nr:LPS export ABC transporter permease LptG [Desulfuromonadales bacterium]
MRKLDRYVLASFGRIFFLSLAAFAGLYLLVDFFERIDNFLSHQARLHHYLLYFASKLPVIVVQVLPLAVLMGVFLALGGFSRTSELTAMRAGGISLWRVAAPLLAASAAATVFMLIASEFLVPTTSRVMNRVLEVEVKGKAEKSLRRDNLWLREGDTLIHVRLATPEHRALEGITLLQMDAEFRLLTRTDARDAVYNGDGWLLRQVTVREFAAGGDESTQIDHLAESFWPFARSPEDFAIPDEQNLELGIRDLYRLVDRLQAEGYDATRYRVDLHTRLATPFACIILAFLGIPFALQKGRNTGLAMGVTLSVGIGIAYFIVQAMLQAFGYSSVLSPVVAAWAANLLFGMLGFWLLLSARH